jgi:hypothetical protein
MPQFNDTGAGSRAAGATSSKSVAGNNGNQNSGLSSSERKARAQAIADRVAATTAAQLEQKNAAQAAANAKAISDRVATNTAAQAQQKAAAQAIAPTNNGSMPDSARGWFGLLSNPVAYAAKGIGSSFMDQTRYGMNERAQGIFDGMDPTLRANLGSEQNQINYARSFQMNEQLPQAMNDSQLQEHNAERATQGLPPVSNQIGGQGGQGGAVIPSGTQDAGTFNPVTFRTGNTGTVSPQYNYDFDQAGAAQSLFDERAALLEPKFAQMNAQNNESMFGGGRLGLRLAGESIGGGVGSGMMQPDAFGVNQAQSQALAQLSAQSTTDAFNQQMAQAGYGLGQFSANQGMLQQQQGLDQNYELGLYGNETARITGQAQANKDNYQPNDWMNIGGSALSAWAGTPNGSNKLNGMFSNQADGDPWYDFWS